MTKKFLILIYLIFPFLCYGNNFNNPESWRNSEIIKILKSSNIDKIEPMKEVLNKNKKIVEFDGEVFLVTFDNNIKGIFNRSFALSKIVYQLKAI